MSRQRVPAKILDKLIHDAAQHSPACAHCVFGSVVEAPVDSAGCNWKVSLIQGSHCVECLASMADFLAGLREEFLLEGPNDMDPGLLTTWAMR